MKEFVRSNRVFNISIKFYDFFQKYKFLLRKFKFQQNKRNFEFFFIFYKIYFNINLYSKNTHYQFVYAFGRHHSLKVSFRWKKTNNTDYVLNRNELKYSNLLNFEVIKVLINCNPLRKIIKNNPFFLF